MSEKLLLWYNFNQYNHYIIIIMSWHIYLLNKATCSTHYNTKQ